MKELSIEEKAKRYDVAIERAKMVLLDCTIEARNAVEFLHPELKESEDEKTRKELINFHKNAIEHLELHGRTDNEWEIGQHKKFLSWLEKQAEHADFRNKIQIGDKVTRNKDGVLVNLSQLNRVAKKDEKQGEQKPAWCFWNDHECMACVTGTSQKIVGMMKNAMTIAATKKVL